MKRAILLVSMLLCACAGARRPPEGPAAPAEAGRHNAALAMVVVSNNSDATLTIAFRTTAAPVHEIGIGRVAPGEHARMAPVPAGEPIVLLARRANGTELKLDAMTLGIDAEWTWQIPRDAAFLTPR